MLYLFYGPDRFRIKKEVEAISKKHSEKHGSESISRFEIREIEDKHLVSELTGNSLFAKSKCIILEGFLKNGSKDLLSFFEKFTEKKSSHVVIFIENEIDQRKKIIKNIKKNGELKKIEHYKPFELNSLIQKKLAAAGMSAEQSVIERISFASEGDLDKLKNDIDKLCAYSKKNKTITSEAIDTLITMPLEENIFQFSENLAKKNLGPALSFFSQQTKKENNAPYLVFMIARQFRNMLIIKSATEERIPEKEVIKKTKMHPYAFQKTKELTHAFSLKELKMILRNILLLDVSIKSSPDPQKSFEEFILKIIRT